jgi:hypothetical protein
MSYQEDALARRDDPDSGASETDDSDIDSMFELKTFYEGPGGPKCSRACKTTTIIATNRTVEIEREGPNVVMAILTLGFCCMFSQASIEIYEVGA